jgi:chromosome segregation ATPase
MVEFGGVTIGTIAQIITMIFSGGIFGGMITYLLGKGRLKVDTAKIEIDAEALLRTHFAETLKTMDERLKASDERAETCDKERRELRDEADKLRKRVRHVEDEMTGLYRMMIQESADKVLAMGDIVPEHIQKLARRTKDAQGAGTRYVGEAK